MGRKQKSWKEQMLEEERQRKSFETRVEADYQRLFNSDIEETLRYIEEVRYQYRQKGINISLNEFRDGYEDFEVAFVYYREESDEEYDQRMKWMEERLQREAEDERRENERKRLAGEIDKLKRQMNAL